MRPTTGSLEFRLMFRLLLILAASFLLFAVVFAAIIQKDAHFDAAEEVGEGLADLAQTINDLPDGRHVFDAAAVAEQSEWLAGAAFAAIALDTNRPVEGSAPALLATLRTRPAAQISSFDMVQTPAGLTVLAVERVIQGGTPYLVGLRRPMGLPSGTLGMVTQEFTTEILPSFLPALILAALVTWITIRTNLRPLRQASLEAAAVSVDKPGQRMSTGGMASEIRPLIGAVNQALQRLESGIAGQKRFTANAAHELRTPLAVLRGRVDSLAPGPMRVALTRDITRLTRVVSQMLLTAQVQSGQMGPSTAVDMTRLVRDVIADLAPIAQESGRDIVLDATGHPFVQGRAAALESAVRNLIENALRYSPPGSAVTVRIRPGVRVEVEDCGPGVPAADRTAVFEPFWRAVDQPAGGAGLGLAIVKEVADQHGGAAFVFAADTKGACFVLEIPEIGVGGDGGGLDGVAVPRGVKDPLSV